MIGKKMSKKINNGEKRVAPQKKHQQQQKRSPIKSK